MWKSGIWPRAATDFFPQGMCGKFTAFHSMCGKKILYKVINRNVFHIPQDLLKTFVIQKGICYFLVAEQESNQRTQPKGASAPIAAPFGNPCRFAGGASVIVQNSSILFRTYQRSKNRNIFALLRIQVKVFRTYGGAAGMGT